VPSTRLYLVRHGATQLTAEDRFAGAVGVDLSDEGRWQADLDLLADEHRQLRATVDALDEADLDRVAGGRPLAWTIRGAAAHDLYHAGQIQLLKTLAPPSRRAAARKGAVR